MNNESFKGHLAVITANVFFGLNISISKSFLGAAWMTPLGFTYTRMFFGLLMFLLMGFFTPKEKTAIRDLPVFALAGLFGLVFAQLAFSVGIRFSSPVTWSLIAALSPIVVLLLSALFLKDPISGRKTAGVLIGISGAILIVLQNRSEGGEPDSLLGIAIALVSITSYAAYLVIMRKTALKYSPVTIMKWMFLFAFIILTPLGIQELPKQRLFTAELALQPVLQLGFSIVFSSTLGFLLTSIALRRIKATTASMYLNLQPLVASTAAIIIGQDIFSWDKPLALLLIASGVFIVTREFRSGNSTAPDPSR